MNLPGPIDVYFDLQSIVIFSIVLSRGYGRLSGYSIVRRFSHSRAAGDILITLLSSGCYGLFGLAIHSHFSLGWDSELHSFYFLDSSNMARYSVSVLPSI